MDAPRARTHAHTQSPSSPHICAHDTHTLSLLHPTTHRHSLFAHTHTKPHARTHAPTNPHTHTHTKPHTHTRTQTQTQTHTNTHTHKHTHAHTCTHTPPPPPTVRQATLGGHALPAAAARGSAQYSVVGAHRLSMKHAQWRGRRLYSFSVQISPAYLRPA